MLGGVWSDGCKYSGFVFNCELFCKKMIGGAGWVFGCDFGVFGCDVLC